MRVVEEELPDMPGQDAFLDVLTNMVGIIILLVVVMGLRSSRAASAIHSQHDPASASAAANSAAEVQLNKSYREAMRARQEFGRVVKQAVDVRRENLFRARERDYLTTYVTAFTQELNDRRATLSTEQQRDFDLRRHIADAQSKLENLSREQVALLSQPAETEVLENRPTPIVRRHLEKELFLQLAQNHVAVIPLADLFAEFRDNVTNNLWRLREEKRMTGTVGPIGDYRMRYVVRCDDVEVRAAAGQSQFGARVQMVRCELVPLTTPLGEPADQAFLPDSDLLAQLKGFSPDSTTISIAVYPDSLPALHSLKRNLHDAGYGVAEILMAQDEPIRFSPNGQLRYAQ
ncbi:MAG: hypothetical protein WD971_13670 [Pirellulales bacterium]